MSDMLQIFVSDIFGRTVELENLVDQVSVNSCILDPYEGNECQFASEKDAYAAFLESGGVVEYSTKLQQFLEHTAKRNTLIGFSAGGSAIWSLLDKAQSNLTDRTICFYPSQVRNNLNIRPTCPVEMILPKREEHFDINEMAEELAQISNVKVTMTDYLHGFMNPRSSYFNEDGRNEYLNWLMQSFASSVSG